MSTVMVVDDVKEVLALTAEILSLAGYTVVSYSNPFEAVGFLRSGADIDLVLTDLEMPGMSGVEFYQLGEDLCPRWVVMTAAPNSDPAKKARALGLPILPKPFKSIGYLRSYVAQELAKGT